VMSVTISPNGRLWDADPEPMLVVSRPWLDNCFSAGYHLALLRARNTSVDWEAECSRLADRLSVTGIYDCFVNVDISADVANLINRISRVRI
jgi:hypothetical protein